MISQVLLALVAVAGAAPTTSEDSQFEKRLNNGLGKTPALGWNGWVCAPIRKMNTHR